jgi:hypothetical protein
MPNLDKFTDEYIKSTPTETLNQERKALIRHHVAVQAVTTAMKAELARRGEEQHAANEVERMDEVKRAALEKALKNARTTGAGKVS